MSKLSLADHRRALSRLDRRMFLRGGLSVGALSLLSGCDMSNGDAVDRVLWTMSRLNDRLQALLFSPHRLAATFPASAITEPFPFNAYYPEWRAPEVDGSTYQLELGGLIADKAPWTLDRLRALPQTSQITRLVCVEGWSAVGEWRGVTFSDFLRRIGADLSARYVAFRCADDYTSSIDMATALHPQTLLALGWRDEVLPRKYGFPMKLRIPTKLGFKNPKYIMAMSVTNAYPGGYWEDQGYNWFSGL